MTERILITAEAPLSFPMRKPGEQFAQSFGYVPGIALWGALGTQLQRTPHARFGPALPVRPGDRWVRQLPATAAACKVHGKLTADGGHGVFDTLIDQICHAALRPAIGPFDPHCPACLGRIDRPELTFYAADAGAQLHARRVQLRTLTRVAIDRRRGTAAEELLYSPVVIAEVNAYRTSNTTEYDQTSFLGTVWDLAGDERAALEQIGALGGRMSSGLGQVQIAVPEPQASLADDWQLPLAERLERFNGRLAERWRVWQTAGLPTTPDWSPDHWRVFTVDLLSDAALFEDGWQPTTIFDAGQLQAETGLEATLIHSLANAQVVGGWNARWNRHRPTTLAAAAGSVFTFRTEASLAELSAALEPLEQAGIGRRRAEGFGLIRICDEFHYQATGEAR